MSSKFVLVSYLTYIPFGVSSENGEDHFTGVSMREMPTHVGTEAGQCGGRTEGLPQVQESVLEHTAKETCPDEEITASALDVCKTDCCKENLVPKVIYLEGVALDRPRTPEEDERATKIFERNERILYPLLGWGRSQAARGIGSVQQP